MEAKSGDGWGLVRGRLGHSHQSMNNLVPLSFSVNKENFLFLLIKKNFLNIERLRT